MGVREAEEKRDWISCDIDTMDQELLTDKQHTGEETSWCHQIWIATLQFQGRVGDSHLWLQPSLGGNKSPKESFGKSSAYE